MICGKTFLATVSTSPGVYQMLNAKAQVIYVGKARNLKKRLQSYFRSNITGKTELMMSQVEDIEIILTETDIEALLLENTLIKKLKPRYNVLFRDDKSYPYIYLSAKHDFPRLDAYRGKRKSGGQYFGPYPNGRAVRHFLYVVQKLFQIRSCRDTFFAHRTRPCLQYQIKRCKAPCVGYVSEEEYAQDLQYAVMLLTGKDQVIIDKFIQDMETASAAQNYELAASLRDQITLLREIHQQQHVDKADGETDVVVLVQEAAQIGLQILMIRQGKILGSKNLFPSVPEGSSEAEVLTSFISQHYGGHEGEFIPKEIITNIPISEPTWLAAVLSERAGRKVKIQQGGRGNKAAWVAIAIQNAEDALARQLKQQTDHRARFAALQKALRLGEPVERIDCFDISHTQGEATVASCVVFTEEGARNDLYRRLNIKDITPGDDYAAMRVALTRRLTKLQETEGSLPDILLIDGGKGQLTQARAVLEELQISQIQLLGIAKGAGRKPEFDRILMADTGLEVILDRADPALHLLQAVRDEAHRFAITGHRKQRAKARNHSSLQDIPGIGAKRRKALLQHFGGMQGLKNASVSELAKVPGISKTMAKEIKDFFRS